MYLNIKNVLVCSLFITLRIISGVLWHTLSIWNHVLRIIKAHIQENLQSDILAKIFYLGLLFTYVLIYNHCKNGWVSWHLFSIYNIHWVSSPYWPFLFSLSELLLGPILFPVAPPSTVTYFTIRDHSKWNLCFFTNHKLIFYVYKNLFCLLLIQ